MAACCLLRRQITEGRQRRGIASGATEHLRTGNQPQSRKVVRSHDPPAAPTASGPSDAVGRPELVRPMVTDVLYERIHRGDVEQLTVRGFHPVLPGTEIFHGTSQRNRGGGPNGIRTRVSALRGPCPGPLDDGAS